MRLDTQGLDDVARQRLPYRCVVKHPVEIGRISDCREADRCSLGNIVALLAQRSGEKQIDAALMRIEPAEAGRRRQFAGMRLRSLQERPALAHISGVAHEGLSQRIGCYAWHTAQNPLGKSCEFRVARRERIQGLAQSRLKRLDIVMRGPAFYPDLVTAIVHLPGVTSGTSETNPVTLPAAIKLPFPVQARFC